MVPALFTPVRVDNSPNPALVSSVAKTVQSSSLRALSYEHLLAYCCGLMTKYCPLPFTTSTDP